MNTTEEVLLDCDEKMAKSLSVLHEQFSGVRTGKASPALVENVKVEYYGTPMRLREIASIATPETRLIVIHAFDPTALPNIEKAILAANLGVTPMNDGRVVRVPIPELTEERRREMTKLSKRLAEEARVAVRNVRREANEHGKALQKNGKATEDERDRLLADIQKTTDEHIAKIDAMLDGKEKEVMSV